MAEVTGSAARDLALAKLIAQMNDLDGIAWLRVKTSFDEMEAKSKALRRKAQDESVECH